MSISLEKKAFDSLKTFGISINDFITKGKSDGILKPDHERYMKWKLNDFFYTDEGVKSSGARGEYIDKEVWFRSDIFVHEHFRKLKQFQELENYLKSIFPNFVPGDLEHFIRKVTHDSFYKENFDSRDMDDLVRIFIKDMKQELVKCGAQVELVGITLKSQKIQVSNGITIRQTEISDVEKEFPEYSTHGTIFQHGGFHTHPSAILIIETYGRNPMEVQRKVEKAFTILRLFKSGSIKYLSYRLNSESITGLMGSELFPDDQHPPLDTCLIRKEDEELLKNFWRIMEHNLQDSFDEPETSTMNYLNIAYKRYVDALLKNGTIERRIANGIMGLEGLFLRDGGEMQELSYRLRLRVARLMSIFGYEPLKLKRVISDAYAIRSRYVHGGLLTYENKKELEEKYTNLKNLLFQVLESLRISIINALLMKVSKEELIDTIDNSFLDEVSLVKLRSITSPLRSVWN